MPDNHQKSFCADLALLLKSQARWSFHSLSNYLVSFDFYDNRNER